MAKIKSFEDLLKIQNDVKSKVALKEEGKDIDGLVEVKVTMATCGVASGSAEIMDYFMLETHKQGMNNVSVTKVGCHGLCYAEPTVEVILPNKKSVIFGEVTEARAKEIIEKYIKSGELVDGVISASHKSATALDEKVDDTKQLHISLRNSGIIDPEKIDDAIGQNGYQALAKALTEMTPDGVIDLVKAANLRGRGGAGFPAGLKWGFARKYEADTKYVICNADEGDPGAFMDRAIIEGDPHTVVEAMAICGYAIGSSEGRVYIRAEYPLAIKRLQKAIDDAVEYGLLGDNIFGTGFNFNIELTLGAGAFVCGEETALLQSMMGERGEAVTKPPFPAEAGYWGKPSNVNNVETFANIPPILLKGTEWFNSIGTEKSKGTKVFALAGKINNVGLVEVPMGTTLREVIYDIGGGVRDGKKFKSVQTGGPSGGCLTEKDLDTPIDFDTLAAKGSIMGSGGMIVLDEDDCMPDIAKFYLGFTADESCGKCTPCRVGTKRMLEILDYICEGRGEMHHLEELKRLSRIIKDTALCGLGQTAPNPVLSTLDVFWDEYLAHVVDKRCPAGVCANLKEYLIDPEKCTGCTICKRECPEECISGGLREVHVIDQDKCTKCGICMSVCRFDAVYLK